MTFRSFLFCAVAVLALTLPSLSGAQQAPLSATPSPMTAPTAPASGASPLNQTLQNLVGVPAPQTPPATPPGALAPTTEDLAGQITDTFATDLLDSLTQLVDELKANSTNWEADISAWPDFLEWYRRQSSDARHQNFWKDVGHDLLIIVGTPLMISVALGLILLPLSLRLRRQTALSVPGRISLLAGLFALRIAPAIVFLSVALLLLEQNEPHPLQRFVILNVIYALGLSYGIRQILRGVFTPRSEHLRLISLSTQRAVATYRWVFAFSVLIILGYFFVDVATSLRVPINSVSVFQNILGLILTLMAIIAVVRTQKIVALILRGKHIDQVHHTFLAAARRWLAENWQTLTIIYLVVGFLISLLGIENGVEVLLRGTILTFLIFLALRLSFVALGWWQTPKDGAPLLIHRQMIAFALRPLIWLAAIVAIAATWGLHLNSVIATPLGQKATDALISIGLTLVILTAVYEVADASIDRHLNRRDQTSKQPVASARTRTLLPMLRNTLFILFCGAAVLACLSAIGFNIGPLLAGAGVIGVAIGFGSQSLVKDFLTGLFIVIENTIAIGDVVKIGEFGGVVEALSIRTIRLRDGDGALHILPFSEVTKISNMTKGFAFAVVDIGVAYDSNLDRVMDVLREVGGQIQEDPIFKRVILEPIEVLGIEKLGDSSITIRARMRTRPGKQWDVQRLLLLRVKQRFDKEGIVIPFPTITHITQNTPPS